MIRLLTLLAMTLFSQQDYTSLRNRMVEEQLVKRGISNTAVIQAMRTVPRHLFVPDDMLYIAYEDAPLQRGEGQTISPP
jgi:protein-L-isoaspartate(D-aspartate) O-methyltransferase